MQKNKGRDNKLNTIVAENTEQGDNFIDVYQRLTTSRIIFINSTITDSFAGDIVATLLAFDSERREEKITLFVNSNGGDIRNILMIYDTMKLIQSPIETICVGSATDEGVILLCAGTPGMRIATNNSVISVGPLINDRFSVGNLSDAKRMLNLHSKDSKVFMEILAKCCKKTVKQINADFDRKTFLTAQQALSYGLIDKIANSNKEI